MEDISNAITILADKVGVGVDTLYQLNLQMQTIRAMSDLITIGVYIVMIGIFGVWLYRVDNSDWDAFWDASGKWFVLFMVSIISAMCILCLQVIIESIVFRVYAPQYMAVYDTISMIGRII